MNLKSHRRSFFKTMGSLAVLAALPFKSGQAAELKPVPEDDVTAKALGYVSDRKKADATKFPILKTPEGKKQSCASCQQYTAKTKPYGACLVLPTGLVNENGWCSAWLLKQQKS